MYRTDKGFMKNPATAHLRIYIGNIADNVIPDDLEEKFKVHGPIQGLVLQKGFGFIQFEAEEQAQSAINAEHGSMFHGRKLNVKPVDPKKKRDERKPAEVVNEKPPEEPPAEQPLVEQPPEEPEPQQLPPPQQMPPSGPPPDKRKRFSDHNRMGPRHDNRMNPRFNDSYRDNYYPMDEFPPRFEPPPMIIDRPERNDCEIIVVSKILTDYAEYIEQRLKGVGLIVDLLFPNEDVPIGRVLANVSSRGCLYAILVMPQNEENRSLTLNILHGVPQEHRNMPIEDAMLLITRNFDAYMRGEKISATNGTMALSDRHPEQVQMLINLVAENRMLTAPQYDKLINYLQERRELQVQQDGGESSDLNNQPEGSKAAELQNRILNILKKKNEEAPKVSSILPPPTNNVGPTPLLNDPSVQKALDSLLQGDMFKNIGSSAADY